MDHRLLLLKPMAAAPVNGAEVSMFERLRILRDVYRWDARISCTALWAHKEGLLGLFERLGIEARVEGECIRYHYNSVPVEVRLGDRFDAYDVGSKDAVKSAFNCAIDNEKPDVVCANITDYFALDCLVNDWLGPSVFFITDNEFPRPQELDGIPETRFISSSIYKIKNAIVASEFLSKSVEKAWKFRPRVFLNPIGAKRFQGYSAEKEYITLVNPIAVKGVDLFLDVARRMPERKFLAVGGWGEELRERRSVLETIGNITVVPYEREMGKIYARSQIVIMPSLWEEAFGRVVLEAFASGTPVIASDTGGLREAGGTAAIYLPVRKMRFNDVPPAQDPKPWVQAIRELDDPATYKNRIEMAVARVSQYEEASRASLKELNQYLSDLIVCRSS